MDERLTITRERKRSPGRLALAVALALALSTAGLVPAAAKDSTSGPAPDPRVAALEMDFLMGMIPHHRSANMMAAMVIEKSDNRTLRDLAQQIIDSQMREIIVMTEYLRDWYGVEPPAGAMMPPEIMERMDMPMLRGMMPDMEARMRELESLSGDQFDIAFMRSMIDHHAMAIMMTAPVLIAGYHPELYGLGTQIVTSQGEEIEKLQRWLAAWYGIEHP